MVKFIYTLGPAGVTPELEEATLDYQVKHHPEHSEDAWQQQDSMKTIIYCTGQVSVVMGATIIQTGSRNSTNYQSKYQVFWYKYQNNF